MIIVIFLVSCFVVSLTLFVVYFNFNLLSIWIFS